MGLTVSTPVPADSVRWRTYGVLSAPLRHPMHARPLILLLLACATPALAEDLPTHGTWSVVFENDLFRETDRDYTGGIAVVWLPRETAPPGWMLRTARALPWFPDHDTVRHGYAFGQNAFTPRDIQTGDPPQDDRPYAGWLWATLGVGAKTGQRIDQFALTVGIVGPLSLAEQAQNAIHSITGSDQPNGWDTQLDNEPALMASYQRSWRELRHSAVDGLDLELTPHLGGTLGNVYTYANGGMTVRLGRGLDRDLGPPRIQPALPGSGFFIPAQDAAWYFFLGLEARVVAHNIFLDGNTFEASRSVEREALVGDLQWGFALTWEEVRLSYTGVVRTREFATQQGHDEFGVFTFSRAF